jgi:D-alanyl-lipoteichoic acid acyltransferase DltB (MBOAT superfamily)
MAFNSVEFLYLLFISFVVYFALPPQRPRNLFLLAVSYFFYMWWRPDYAVLMLITSLVGFLTALGMENAPHRRRVCMLVTSLVVNLGILFVFKYYLFTRASLIFLRETFPFLPTGLELPFLDVLLPVGISFYTFQVLAYNIDIYWRRISAERDFFTFALFVSFFPQLVAGPIERASRFLPRNSMNRIVSITKTSRTEFCSSFGASSKKW